MREAYVGGWSGRRMGGYATSTVPQPPSLCQFQNTRTWAHTLNTHACGHTRGHTHLTHTWAHTLNTRGHTHFTHSYSAWGKGGREKGGFCLVGEGGAFEWGRQLDGLLRASRGVYGRPAVRGGVGDLSQQHPGAPVESGLLGLSYRCPPIPLPLHPIALTLSPLPPPFPVPPLPPRCSTGPTRVFHRCDLRLWLVWSLLGVAVCDDLLLDRVQAAGRGLLHDGQQWGPAEL